MTCPSPPSRARSTSWCTSTRPASAAPTCTSSRASGPAAGPRAALHHRPRERRHGAPRWATRSARWPSGQGHPAPAGDVRPVPRRAVPVTTCTAPPRSSRASAATAGWPSSCAPASGPSSSWRRAWHRPTSPRWPTPASRRYHAVRKAVPLLYAGTHAVMIGAGGLGHIGLQTLLAITPAEVIVVDQSEEALAKAADLGAHHTVLAGDDHVAEVMDLTGGLGAHVVFDFVGEHGTEAAGRGDDPRGRVLLRHRLRRPRRRPHHRPHQPGDQHRRQPRRLLQRPGRADGAHGAGQGAAVHQDLPARPTPSPRWTTSTTRGCPAAAPSSPRPEPAGGAPLLAPRGVRRRAGWCTLAR